MRKRSFNYLYQIIFVFLLSFLGGNILAQDPVFVARTSGSTLAQHSVFSVQFELKNATSSKFQPPSFKGFRIVGGPSTSSSTMIVNGVVNKSQTWTYSVLATKKGKQTIGAAKVIIGKRAFKTKPIKIRVLESSEQARQRSPSDSKDPVFLRAELSDSIFYPGQQIILTYKLLFKENVQTVNTIAEDDYADFFVQHFSNLDPLAEYETINGVQYTSRVVKSIALFAHQSGTYEIDPLVMKAGINAPFEANRGFFSMRRVQNVQVASVPMTVQVEPLPSNVPDNFSGAVGQYQMRLSPGSRPLTTNNTFAFTLEITGNGDSRRWELPTPVTDGEFEIYNPKIMKDEQYESEGVIVQRRTVLYQMLPAAPGKFNMHVPFTYFDPEAKAFVTINSDTISRNVAQGKKNSGNVQSDIDEAFIPELMSVKKPWFKDKFWTSFPHLFLFGLFLSSTGVGFMRVWRHEREQDIPIEQRVRRAAGQKANEKLTELEGLMDGIPANEFFASATEVFYSFLIERFTIPSSELDEAGLATYLSKSKISEPLADQTKNFFSQCLSVRYGGTPGGFSKSEMINVCRDLISSLQA